MLPDNVINQFSSQLLQEEFSPRGVIEWMIGEYGVAEPLAEKLVYGSIRDINVTLFPAITKMELFLTEKCNLRCDYCFEKGMDKHRVMSRRVAENAIDFLIDYSGTENDLQISYFGGEPCTQYPLIRSITEYAKTRLQGTEKRIGFGITSNGTLLSEEMLHYFSCNDIKVLLSIDGLAETHDRYRKDARGAGSYKQTLDGMRLLKRYQRWVGVRLTVMPETAGKLYDNVTGLYAEGVNQFIIGPASGVRWDEEQKAQFCKKMVEVRDWYRTNKNKRLRISEFDEKPSRGAYFGCQAGRNSVSISPNGGISGCSKILALNNNRLIGKLGDVKWGITNIRNRAEMVRCYELKENCKKAGLDTNYQGGCFASNFEFGGNLYTPDIESELFKKQVDLALSRTDSTSVTVAT